MGAWLAVALGSAIGGVVRYECARLATLWLGAGFPWGTIGINVIGSAIIGAFGSATAADGRRPLGPTARLFVMVGFCGGYTTFSAFSLQTVELLRAGAPLAALANVALSLGLCLGGAWLGYALARPRRA